VRKLTENINRRFFMDKGSLSGLFFEPDNSIFSNTSYSTPVCMACTMQESVFFKGYELSKKMQATFYL